MFYIKWKLAGGNPRFWELGNHDNCQKYRGPQDTVHDVSVKIKFRTDVLCVFNIHNNTFSNSIALTHHYPITAFAEFLEKSFFTRFKRHVKLHETFSLKKTSRNSKIVFHKTRRKVDYVLGIQTIHCVTLDCFFAVALKRILKSGKFKVCFHKSVWWQ